MRVQLASSCCRRVSRSTCRTLSTSRPLYEAGNGSGESSPAPPAETSTPRLIRKTAASGDWAKAWRARGAARTTPAPSQPPQPLPISSGSAQNLNKSFRRPGALSTGQNARGNNINRPPRNGNSAPRKSSAGAAAKRQKSEENTEEEEEDPLLPVLPYVGEERENSRSIAQATTQELELDPEYLETLEIHNEKGGIITWEDDPAVLALDYHPQDLMEAYENEELEPTELGMEHLANPFDFDDPMETQKMLEAAYEEDVKSVMAERRITREEAEDVLTDEVDVEEEKYFKQLVEDESQQRIRAAQQATEDDLAATKAENKELEDLELDDNSRATQLEQLLSDDPSWIFKIMQRNTKTKPAVREFIEEELRRLELKDEVIDNARGSVMSAPLYRPQTKVPRPYKEYSGHSMLRGKSRTSEMKFMATLLASNASASLQHREALADNVNQILGRKKQSRTKKTGEKELQLHV